MKKTFNIIPAIDILDAQVVRLTKGDFNQKSHYAFSPQELAKQYEDAGAKRIHIVDLNGAKDGTLVNKSSLEAIREHVNVSIQVGGGIRSLNQAKQIIDIGVDFIILGSLLLDDPKTALEIINHYPNQVYAGLDVRDLQLATQGWLKKSSTNLFEMIKSSQSWPLAGYIVTDIKTDGTLEGPNLELISQACNQSKHPIIASGGIGCLKDIIALKALNKKTLFGCITGKAIMEDKLDLKRLFTALN